MEFGFNNQVSENWINREALRKFSADESLLMTNEEFTITIDLFSDPNNNLRLLYEEAKKNWEDALQKLREADDIISNSQGSLMAIDGQIKQLDMAQLPDKEREMVNFKNEKRAFKSAIRIGKQTC